MESHSKAAIVGISLVLGLAVGGGVGYAVSNSMNDDNSSSNTSMSREASSDSSDGVTVGGAKMVKDKDIVDNAANAKNVTTLVSAVQAADLVDTLKGEGPFTVFGPTNDAFNKLPEGTLDTLLMEENKAQLAGILTYHVVPGTFTTADLRVLAQKGESLPASANGGTLTPVLQDGELFIRDAKGGLSKIETSDVISSNGVTHVVDAVLMPQS